MNQTVELTTAERILQAAGELLDQEGSEAVSMRRVAGAVGITAMAVYRHFPNREGLLNAMADAGFVEVRQRLLAVPGAEVEKRLTAVLDVYLDFALEKPRLFELMFLSLRLGARQYPGDFRAGASPTANVAAELIEQGMQSGVFRRSDVWEITLEMGALLQGMVMLYLGGRIGMKAGEFQALCHRSFRRYFDGIRA
ncbi:MAG TPA: TetR/AcrR family transcriptional regulator [Acidobacteriaceae bacterium]|nr:TetR/AcrR family transcriptional regulator [Acidobacteriaceae bacterium]